MHTSSYGPLLALLGLVGWSSQASGGEDTEALRCAAIGDDRARLACYDGIFRASGGLAPAGATAAGAAQTEAAPVAAAPADPAGDFGLTPARKASIAAAEAKATGAPVVPAKPAIPDSVTAKVATVAHRLTGELVVILDDNQVWVQIDTETKGRVKEGDEVTIRRGTLGSYLLVTPNHILVRVRRVK